MSGDDPRIERYLRGLPREAPDPALEAQVIQRHLRRRRMRRVLPVALAASLVAGFLSWQGLHPVGEGPAQIAAPPRPAPALAEIRALDRQLQEGYLAGMSEPELAHLWQQRQVAMRAIEQPAPEHVEVRL